MLYILCITGAVILLGKTNMFRFNHPGQVAQLKKDFKGVSLPLHCRRNLKMQLIKYMKYIYLYILQMWKLKKAHSIY